MCHLSHDWLISSFPSQADSLILSQQPKAEVRSNHSHDDDDEGGDFEEEDCDDNDDDQNDNDGGDGQVYAAMAESLGGAWKEIHQARNFIVFADLERNYIIWELVSGGFEAETSA